MLFMNSTGCGKTSLMNVLAARVYGSNFATTKLTGNIFVNGSVRDDTLFRKISAYVLQVQCHPSYHLHFP